jgi:hypothetical protein
MAKELVARGQVTVYTQTDAYSVYLSRQSYVVSTDRDGKISSAVTVTAVVSAKKGTIAITPVIGTLPSVSGCTLSKAGTTLTLVFIAGTSLADSGMIDIPVTVDGNSFTVSFAYAKARQGDTGAPGVDANLLDWVSDWNTGKTLIGSNSVVTPKIFAGVKNANGTLTGIALGRFPLSTVNASGSVVTETIDGIYGFKDGYKTFFIDNGGNAQLGRGEQSIKFNAANGKIEFGQEVSLNWIGATYIDAGGIFTGTLSAGTVNAVNINASQITAGTVNAARIDVAALKASLITAANIEALTLNVTKGSIGGWIIDADSIFKGTKNNTAGTYTGASGAITIGSNGIRGYKWRLEATGAGAVAGGNIAWDASGNVTFAASVSLNWTTPINSITTALGGSSFPRLTKIDANGIYTGTLTASQVNAVSIDAASIKTGTLSADRIASGSITSAKLDAASIRANIINTSYINGLYCNFEQGTIGSWNIEWDCISSDYLRLGRLIETAPNYVSGFGVQMISPYSGEECFCLSMTDWGDPYNHIAGWMFDEYYIWKNNVVLDYEGSIYRYGKWYLRNDGSGSLASGNISWNASGTVTFSSSVSLNWITPINNITTALGGSSFPKLTKIDATGIYTGTLTASQITAGTVSAEQIATGSITAEKLDAASIKSAIINTDYINGLSCTFARGTIGGWMIASDTVYHNNSGKYVILRSNETGGSGAPGTYGRRGLTVYLEDAVISSGAVKVVQMGMLSNSGAPQTYPSTPNYGFRILLQGNKEVFRADSTGAMIAGWKIDADSIFRGTKNNSSGGYTSASGYITMGSYGIRGYKWRLDANGAGAVAGGNIAWNGSGNVTFAPSVSLNWENYTDSKMNSLDVDGRNYALNTSNEWSAPFTLYNSFNYCIMEYKVKAENWEPGDTIFVSFDYKYENIAKDISNTTELSIQGTGDMTSWTPGFTGYALLNQIDFAAKNGTVHIRYSFTLSEAQSTNTSFTLNIRHDYLTGNVFIRNLKVEKNKKTGWSPAPEDLGSRLTKITATGIYTGTVTSSQISVDSTLVVGGSSYNGSISVRDASNSVKVTLNRTGITAVGGTIGGWTIASNQISKNSVILSSDGSITNGTKWKLNNDGSGQFANGNISWTASGTVTVTGTINASAGTIGGFEIGSGRIGSTASGSGSGGGLAIYNDLFRVGSSTSYVLFGDDTIPATAGGAFTATGRVTNNKSNSGYTNCGIYINVTGGTKNFGVHSNATLMAPAVIGNKIKTVAFSGNGYSLDFSQHNVFFIYGTSSYSVTLPTESQVASMFSLSSLPSDFGFVFTLVYNYNYGNQLTINGIRNNNGDTANYPMAKGDSLTILCAKFPSFHYQVINHYS